LLKAPPITAPRSVPENLSGEAVVSANDGVSPGSAQG